MSESHYAYLETHAADVDDEDVRQAARYYAVWRAGFIPETTMLRDLEAAVGKECFASAVAALRDDPAEQTALARAVLATAWNDDAQEAERIRATFRETKELLPFVDPNVVIFAILFLAHLFVTKGMKRQIETEITKRDGMVERKKETEYAAFSEPVVSFFKRLFS